MRGYLTGSAWKEYQADGHHARRRRCPRACSSRRSCPSRCSPRRPRPRSATTTRTSSFDAAVDLVGTRAGRAGPRRLARALPRGARRGPPSGASSSPTPSSSSASSTASWSLADEVLTPDSSRFWPADEWEPGHDPAVVRQAAGARLPRRRSTGTRRRRRRRCPAEVVEATERPLRRGLRAHHRPVASPTGRAPT